ncbi:MAG: helix-turn-helix domain-containing protein [Bryobacteraceae bacterium]|nr:helix-turn-helix domain-containing protein [Bryobacteraceae bacterium]MCX7604400.1 helix-turn-helix domain-containing protein [Bryobacteraceae bacterium]
MNAADDPVPRYADVFAALGTEPRLRILRLLLAAHPGGLYAGDLQTALQIPPSTLSHHLEKLRHERLVTVRRKGTFHLYTANTETLREVVTFLYSQCCGRGRQTGLGDVTQLCECAQPGE